MNNLGSNRFNEKVNNEFHKRRLMVVIPACRESLCTKKDSGQAYG
jgi:hypothetical protein